MVILITTTELSSRAMTAILGISAFCHKRQPRW